MYHILTYTFNKAKKLNVIIKPSKNIKYKIDIYDNKNNFLFSGGATGYSDYPHYILSKGKIYADERKRLYNIRHKKELLKPYSKGWYVAQLLW